MQQKNISVSLESNQTYFLSAEQIYNGTFPTSGTQLSINNSLLTLVDAIRGFAVVQLSITSSGASSTCNSIVSVSFSTTAFLLEPKFNQVKYMYVPFQLKWPIVPPFSTSETIRIDLLDASGALKETVMHNTLYGVSSNHFHGVSKVYPENFYILNVTIGSHGPFIGTRIKVVIR